MKHAIIPVLTREDIIGISFPRADDVTVPKIQYWDFRNGKWASFFIPKAGMQFWLQKLSYYGCPKFVNTHGIVTDKTASIPQMQIGIRPCMIVLCTSGKNVDGCYSEMDYWYNEGKRVATLALFRYVHSEMDEHIGEWIKENVK